MINQIPLCPQGIWILNKFTKYSKRRTFWKNYEIGTLKLHLTLPSGVKRTRGKGLGKDFSWRWNRNQALINKIFSKEKRGKGDPWKEDVDLISWERDSLGAPK